jgi:ATP-binding cassette, subfamily B, bacterial HlyB/CyaB
MAEKFSHSAVQCLAAIAQSKGIRITPERLIHDFALSNEEPGIPTIVRMASEIGLHAKGEKLDWARLVQLEGIFPFLARLKNDTTVIVVGAEGQGDEKRLAVVDPCTDTTRIQHVDQQQFSEIWSGNVIFIKRAYSLLDESQPFGLRWFLPEIFKQRSAFRDVIIAAMAMNLLALASPMFFQLVIDKVLVHQSSSTLLVLTVGVSIALLFDALFSYIRQMLLLAATNKIDMRVTRRAFKHLLSLPIDFFETSTAGVVTRQMQQLEGIRHFLTGRLMFSVMDALALIIFLPLLFTYSATLALIVLGFTLLMALIIAGLLPTFLERLDKLNTAEGQRQSLLVETIHGMRTVKALAIEPIQRKSWDQLSANSINAHYKVSQLSISGNTLTDFLAKFMPIVIILVGAQGVFDQTMTVGVLIAFQMLSGRVVGPLVQIVGLINEYQQTIISVKMLADIMNRAPEGRLGGGGLRPQLKGEITFEDVTFRYPGSGINALNKTRFTIEPGTVVGIVGRSGSGKTTLTKLIQGLYSIQEGVVRFDGIDAREIDLAHLRKQIGVVLQENFLFRGSVRDNITASKPDATDAQIVAAAQAAGATEFIERMPQGYDTPLEENAANLSGGQKQRLSIARALLANPHILILDEAASALDPESEAIFINNLSKICVGRTVIMVSHRLSTLVYADKILVMQNGQLSDAGRHEELLTRCETYQTLWNQQTSHI